MRAANTVFILSDEHDRGVLGCFGDPVVRTPILDDMAAPGGPLRQCLCQLTGLRAGAPCHPEDDDLPGSPLSGVLDGPDNERAVFREEHDWSSIPGMFMLRKGPWKLVAYSGYPPQLFHLERDPEERSDLAGQADCRDVLAARARQMAAVADIEAVSCLAFADQRAKIARPGGRRILEVPD